MATVEVLSGIMGATVVLLNLYTLVVKIVGSEEVEDCPFWHRISGFTETMNYIALSVCLVILILETSEHSQKIQLANSLAEVGA